MYAPRGERRIGIVALGLDPVLAIIEGPRELAQGLTGLALLVLLGGAELRVEPAKALHNFVVGHDVMLPRNWRVVKQHDEIIEFIALQ